MSISTNNVIAVDFCRKVRVPLHDNGIRNIKDIETLDDLKNVKAIVVGDDTAYDDFGFTDPPPNTVFVVDILTNQAAVCEYVDNIVQLDVSGRDLQELQVWDFVYEADGGIMPYALRRDLSFAS